MKIKTKWSFELDYKKCYNNLIIRAKLRTQTPNSYYELHHIIPRCIGGTDSEDNLVYLLAREHFVAHKLLTKLYPGNSKIAYGFWALCFLKTKPQQRYICNNRDYQLAKELLKSKTNDHKLKISDGLREAYQEGKRTTNLGKKMPPEFGQAISKSKKGMVGTNLGIPMSDIQKNKISNTLLGHSVSNETKTKISDTLRNKPTMICPCCGKSSRGTAFKFYHFENCKQNNNG